MSPQARVRCLLLGCVLWEGPFNRPVLSTTPSRTSLFLNITSKLWAVQRRKRGQRKRAARAAPGAGASSASSLYHTGSSEILMMVLGSLAWRARMVVTMFAATTKQIQFVEDHTTFFSSLTRVIFRPRRVCWYQCVAVQGLYCALPVNRSITAVANVKLLIGHRRRRSASFTTRSATRGISSRKMIPPESLNNRQHGWTSNK